VFRDVYVVKPESSRALSAESFVVGLGFLPGANLALLSDSITVLPASLSPAQSTQSTAAIESSQQQEESKEEAAEEDSLTF